MKKILSIGLLSLCCSKPTLSDVPTFIFAFEAFEGRTFNSSAEFAKNSKAPFVILPVNEEAEEIALEQAMLLKGHKFLVTGEFHGDFIRVDEFANTDYIRLPVTWDAMPLAKTIALSHSLPVKRNPTAGNYYCNRVLAALLKKNYDAAIIHLPVNLRPLNEF